VFATGSTGTPSDTNFDVITDFATASDVIDHDATITIVTNTSTTAGTASISAAGIATFVAADDTLAERITATEAAINAGGTAASGQTAAFMFGADAYVFISDGVDGVGANDVLVRLNSVDLTSTSFDTLTLSGTNMTIA
jgi:hypothetical protein